jgi:hypothetical protein
MVEAKPLAVRPARDQLAAEVEQLRVTCQYQETSPPLPATGSSTTTSRSAAASGPGDVSSHPEQTSQALGVAGVQVGPRAVALAAWASKGLSVPASKVARLGQLGATITPGGVTQRWHGRSAVCSRPTPRWSAARRPARSSPRMRPAGASAAGAAPRTAGGGLCVSHGPIVDASETGDVTRKRREFAKRRLMEATRTRLQRRAGRLTRLAVL